MSSSSDPPPPPPRGKQEEIKARDKTSMNKRTEAEKCNDEILKACIATWLPDGSTCKTIVSPEVEAMNAKIERAMYEKRKNKKRLPVFEEICPSKDKD